MYPGGRAKLDRSIHGGELFKAFLYNPVSQQNVLALLTYLLNPDFIFQLLRFVPVAGVGSRQPLLLIPDLQAVLSCGLMPPRLQTFMSALTQSDHVFLGLPRTLEHGTSILVTDLIQVYEYL